MTRRPVPLLLLILIAAVYLWRLGEAPVYLMPDETLIANDAYAVATTGRAVDGTFLPLYFRAGIHGSWFMPVIYYSIALALQVVPLAEWAIRTPTALAGLLSIALTYFVGRRLYGDLLSALVAAAALACAPAFFILSRYALDYTLPVPFILGWLLCLVIALESGRSRWWLAAAGLCLGVGWYSYISSIVMMPLYCVVTLAVLIARKRGWRDVLAFSASFVAPLTLFAVWLMQHPDAVRTTAWRYGLIESPDTATGMMQGFDAAAMFTRYINFFGFDFLFRLGDTYLPFSTRTVGVFVGATGILIAAGIITAVTMTRNAMTLLILIGFLLSPLPAIVLQDDPAIRRSTGMIAFGALLAGLGAAGMRRLGRIPFFKALALVAGVVGLLTWVGVMAWTGVAHGHISALAIGLVVIPLAAFVVAALSERAPHGQLVAVSIALVMVLQFAAFLRTYHGEYVSRVSVWLQGAIRGALVQLMAESDRRPEAPVYFATLRAGRGDADLRNLYLPSYWRFYTTKHNRETLHDRAIFMKEGEPLDAVPKGSLILGNLEDPNVKRLLSQSSRRLADIPELDRPAFFTIIER